MPILDSATKVYIKEIISHNNEPVKKFSQTGYRKREIIRPGPIDIDTLKPNPYMSTCVVKGKLGR